MKINITEMMRIKGRLNDINNEMGATFTGINQEFGSIADNINSASLHQSIVNIQESIINLGGSFTQNMVLLENFVNDQLSSYTISNEDASNSLNELIAMVNNTFDNDGNVIVNVSASTTSLLNTTSTNASSDNPSASTRRADSNIGDSGGYSTGEGLQDTFANKIGNSEEKWDIVDTTYYYFKDKGLSDEQIAGIIGNMTQESALDLRCPTGQYQGLFQWGRDRYPSGWDLDTQLDHAWQEIEHSRNNGKVLSNLSQKNTVNDATESFAYWFEGCTTEMDKRQKYANAVYYYIKNNL